MTHRKIMSVRKTAAMALVSARDRYESATNALRYNLNSASLHSRVAEARFALDEAEATMRLAI